MKNYWRQFMGLAIDLKDKTYIRTKTGLTFAFFLTVILVLVASHLLRSYTILVTNTNDPTSYPGSNLAVRLISATFLDFVRSGVFEQITIGILVLIAGWVIVGKLLKPMEEIQNSQKMFMADAAHELFTPLSIMKTNAEVALMDGPNLSVQTATETIHSTLEEVDRMSNIIKNLMKLSSKTEMSFTKINMSEIATKMVNSIEPSAAEKSIKISTTKNDSAVMWGNETALEEMMLNLLTNAVRHTNTGGLIRVYVTDNNPESIELRIQDNGAGIPAKDLPHIFEPFYRGRHEPSVPKHSAGLGLAIVKEIVKLHNGSVKIRSTEGRGTVVDVYFSLATS